MNILLRPALMLLLPIASMMPASPSAAQDKTPVSLATATAGGGFPVYGDAFAATINGTDPTLLIQTRNTKGSAENIPLIENGQVDIALVQGEAAYEAFAGIGRTPANMKIIAGIFHRQEKQSVSQHGRSQRAAGGIWCSRFRPGDSFALCA